MNDNSRMIRAKESTVNALRMASMELAISRQQFFGTDDERIAALVDHWEQTKPVVIFTETGVQPASPGLEAAAA